MGSIVRFVVPAFLILGIAPLSAIGCGGDEGTEGDDANITSGTCEVFSAVTKKPLTQAELAGHKDPIAQKILLGDGCPKNLNEITTKLSANDGKNCQGGNDGLSTRLVNDSAFLTGKDDGSYRGVVTRDCDGRGQSELFMSIFGISPAAPSLPQEQTEMVGFDKTAGVFNFYVRESKENRFVFMGSSEDGIKQGYKCDDNGACEPVAAKDARCWACHEGGGLNMKELNSPWDSWNLNTGMPGNDAIIKKFGKQLGRAETGIELEGRVSGGNTTWNKKRIEILKDKGAEEVLRPLFCTVSINLQSAGGANNLSNIPGNFYVSDTFGGNVAIDNGLYQAQIKANGQKITDGSRTLQGKNGAVTDTQSAFRYPEKSFIDVNYIQQLVQAKIVDDDFVKDVLSIDLTRPVFSKTRCDLVKKAPDLKGSSLTADKIRDGFITNLKGASGAGGDLLTALQNKNDAADHQKAADDFFKACAARPKKDFIADTLQYLAHTRFALLDHKGTEGAGRGQGIIEFPETLPVDNLKDTDKAFDPATCTLK
jgi:hypothetical protein